ncbi:TetR/AcrR family transcriptional regulator [Pedobacter sp. W3I1]|uniref:TetR/AcrR family transcriptional regulator n=1 Tax=Pedobacter sp. W3I1 TaxID=3042291 RepID=UPI0027D9210A|nr:TetR/AcrR family transcriptional regulator [Pedobacter sp. W3I1]
MTKIIAMLSKAEKTKQFILETAMPLYNEKGVAGVTIDDILAATKLTKGALYGHFDGKDDLSLQVIDYSLDKVSQRIRSAVSTKKTVKAKIWAFIDFYKDPIDTLIPGGCPIFNTAVETDDNYPWLKKKVAKVLRQGQEELTALLQSGINNGEFTPELDPANFAFKLVASIEGATVMCRAMEVTKPMLALVKSLKAELARYEK